MSNPTLWTAPYQAHSDTSRAAAESVQSKTANLREIVYNTLAQCPMTDEELINKLGLSQNTVRPRRVELLHAGRVEPDGRRATSSGRAATVWRVIVEPATC